MTGLRIILLVVGVGLLLWGAYENYRRRMMAATPTIGAGDVAKVADEDREVRVEVAGAATPGPRGPLTAPLSGTPCVWYRTRITRSYRKWERDSNGNRREVTGTNTVYERQSSDPFVISDVSGQVPLHPADGRPDGAERVLSEREYAPGPMARKAKGAGARDLDAGPGRTRYHRYEEWVIRPGTNLYVLGAVRGSAGGADGIAIRKPRNSPFIISTRSERELRQALRTRSLVGYALGAVTLIGTAAWWIVVPGA